MKTRHFFTIILLSVSFLCGAQKTHDQYLWTIKNYAFENFVLPPQQAHRFDTCKVPISRIIATIAEFDPNGNETIKKDTMTSFSFQKILDTVSVDSLNKILESPLELYINHAKTQVTGVHYVIVCENELPFYAKVQSASLADNQKALAELKKLRGNSYLFITTILYPSGRDHLNKTINDIIGFRIRP